MLLFSLFEVIFSLIVVPIYLILIYMLLPPSNSRGVVSVSYEVVFLVIGFPGGLPFYIKLLSIYSAFNFGGLMLIVILIGFVLNLVRGFNIILYSYKLPYINPKLFIPFFIFFLVVFLL